MANLSFFKSTDNRLYGQVTHLLRIQDLSKRRTAAPRWTERKLLFAPQRGCRVETNSTSQRRVCCNEPHTDKKHQRDDIHVNRRRDRTVGKVSYCRTRHESEHNSSEQSSTHAHAGCTENCLHNPAMRSAE